MGCKFDQIWIDNRFRYRNGMKGSRMRLDEATGYLEPSTRRGFSAEMKAVFIKRFTVCSNRKAIAKSLFVDIQSVYDALALDKKFREDFIKAESIIERSPRLNDELVKLATSEKTKVVMDLTASAAKYLRCVCKDQSDPYIHRAHIDCIK